MSAKSVAHVVVLFASAVLTANVQAQQKFVEGPHYQAISPPQPTSSPADVVEVAVVFMYACPHCFGLEPHLRDWSSAKPSYVNIVYLPTAFNETAKLHARAYYSAEALGVIEKMHDDMFHAIHVEERDLSTQENVRDFFGAHGVEATVFEATFKSPEVESKAHRADELVRRYGVSGTPQIVVNGKYVTGLQRAGSYEALFELINELAAREHRELIKPSTAQ